jgi:hypothetical protein
MDILIGSIILTLLLPFCIWVGIFTIFTPFEDKCYLQICIGPGCELGYKFELNHFYWCPFGMLSIETTRINKIEKQ